MIVLLIHSIQRHFIFPVVSPSSLGIFQAQMSSEVVKCDQEGLQLMES